VIKRERHVFIAHIYIHRVALKRKESSRLESREFFIYGHNVRYSQTIRDKNMRISKYKARKSIQGNEIYFKGRKFLTTRNLEHFMVGGDARAGCIYIQQHKPGNKPEANDLRGTSTGPFPASPGALRRCASRGRRAGNARLGPTTGSFHDRPSCLKPPIQLIHRPLKFFYLASHLGVLCTKSIHVNSSRNSHVLANEVEGIRGSILGFKYY